MILRLVFIIRKNKILKGKIKMISLCDLDGQMQEGLDFLYVNEIK